MRAHIDTYGVRDDQFVHCIAVRLLRCHDGLHGLAEVARDAALAGIEVVAYALGRFVSDYFGDTVDLKAAKRVLATLA
jgi:hypothetical protein